MGDPFERTTARLTSRPDVLRSTRRELLHRPSASGQVDRSTSSPPLPVATEPTLPGDRKTLHSILVSACLLGQPVRYHNGDARCDSVILKRWIDEGRVVAFCPEVAGGLPTPRSPAEIAGAAGGDAVLTRGARVVEQTGGDVTTEFVHGATQALSVVQHHGIRLAILKEGSPSCGSAYTHDGQFAGNHIRKPGVTTALLQQHGIRVFNETQLDEAVRFLEQFENKSSTLA